MTDSTVTKMRRWLGKRRSWVRILFAFLFVVGLCCFLQFQKSSESFLALHSVSKQYIVAQTTFEFPDEDKRFSLQQQAVKELGPVYSLGYRQIHKVEEEFFANFMQDPLLQELFADVSQEQLRSYLRELEEFLIDSCFCGEFAAKAFKEEGGEEIHVFEENTTPPIVSSSFWMQVKEHLPKAEKSEPWAEAIFSFFEKQSWVLLQDEGLERRLQEFVKKQVPEQYKLVREGSFILEPGERITQYHIRMVQAMKNAFGESLGPHSLSSFLGSLSLSLIISFLTIIYLKIHHEGIYSSLRKLALLLLITAMTLSIASIVEYLLMYEGYQLIETLRVPLVIPFASLLICLLLGARIALFGSIFLSVIVSLSLSVEYDRFLILNLLASISVILFARGLHRRKDIFEVCVKVWLCCIPVLVAFHLRENTFCNFAMVMDLGMSFISMMLSAVIVVGFLPLFESLFKVMTDMSLMEYMDPNNELLRRLSLEAPGTYQHSLVVGHLAEIAARAIGANDLFCRVAALYHDIGKLSHPHYFTENQVGGFNIHQLLTPLESTQVIISHVLDGEALAKRYRLPKGFIDMIREHHGTTLVYFFYCKQIEQMEGDPSRVNEHQFRYTGPKPHSREAALLMIADTIEAASRSLDEVTEEVLTKMVDRLVSEKAEEGQFDECLISFKELSQVKKAIVKALLISRHLRIKYPEKDRT